MNNITGLIKGVKNVGASGWDSLKTIATFLNYLMHPSMVVKALWEYTLAYSFWICSIIAVLSVVFYAIGFKKCAKFIPGSLAVYALIKMIGSAF